MPPNQNQNTQANTNFPQDDAAQVNNTPPSPFPNPTPPAPVSGTGDVGIRDDVAKILGEIKLPERKSFQAEADTAPVAPPPTPTPNIEKNAISLKKPGTYAISPALDQIPHQTPQNEFARADAARPPTSDIRPVHTLKDDLAHITQEKKLSLVQVVALEEEKRGRDENRRAEQKNRAQPHRSGRRLLIITLFSAILIALGGLALGSIAFIQSQQTTPATAPVSDIMFAEQTFAFPLPNTTPRIVRQQLASARTQVALTLGAIARIVPAIATTTAEGITVDQPSTLEEFFVGIGATPPDNLIRALSTEFFLGVHAVDQNVPLLVVPVVSYERAFSGMLEWEHHLNEDLEPFFTYVPAQAQYTDGTIKQRTFEDVIVQNYDVRVVKDAMGNIRLLYAFPTRSILIIAESPFSFTEALSRLRAERRL